MLFKKKKEEEIETLPELPPLPPLPGEMEAPELPEMEERLPELRPIRPMAPMLRAEEVCLPRTEMVKVFVRIDKYKEAMREIECMQHKVDELQKTLDKISSIKEKEAEIITGWNALLAEAKEKIDEVDHKLTKPEHIC